MQILSEFFHKIVVDILKKSCLGYRASPLKKKKRFLNSSILFFIKICKKYYLKNLVFTFLHPNKKYFKRNCGRKTFFYMQICSEFFDKIVGDILKKQIFFQCIKYAAMEVKRLHLIK